jgi:hypothetical protein
MGIFREKTDDEILAAIEKRTNDMLTKNYDLLPDQRDYPDDSYILKPEKLIVHSFFKVSESSIRINIGYSYHFSRFVTDSKRVGYDRIVKGSLLCDSVNEFKEITHQPKSSISTSLFSKYKTLIAPIEILNQSTSSVKKYSLSKLAFTHITTTCLFLRRNMMKFL